MSKLGKSAQPLEYPSAGSVFKNPIESPAWKLISSVNLKDFKRGGSMISKKHANFIINIGDYKSKDDSI